MACNGSSRKNSYDHQRHCSHRRNIAEILLALQDFYDSPNEAQQRCYLETVPFREPIVSGTGFNVGVNCRPMSGSNVDGTDGVWSCTLGTGRVPKLNRPNVDGEWPVAAGCNLFVHQIVVLSGGLAR